MNTSKLRATIIRVGLLTLIMEAFFLLQDGPNDPIYLIGFVIFGIGLVIAVAVELVVRLLNR